MGYELYCKSCKAQLGVVNTVSSRTFSSSCHVSFCEIVTWNKRTEFKPCGKYPNNYEVICYECGTLHSVYGMENGKKYILRRKK